MAEKKKEWHLTGLFSVIERIQDLLKLHKALVKGKRTDAVGLLELVEAGFKALHGDINEQAR